MSKGTIGIDVGGSKTLFALLDGNFKPVAEIKVKTTGDNEPAFTNAVTKAVGELLKKAKALKLAVEAIGAGFAGTIDIPGGIVLRAPNLPALVGYSLESVLRNQTKARVRIYNDVHAALYGELKFGAAAGCRDVIGVFIGTGVAAALVINGKLYTGASQAAGNIGHFLVEPVALGASKLHGRLDDFVSRTAIAAGATALAAKNRAPNLSRLSGTDLKNVRSGALAKAIAEGDQAVGELVRTRARLLGTTLSNVIDLLNPEMLVLGGGLTDKMPGLIRQEVTAGIKLHATDEAVNALRVVTSKLKSHAATVGAAKLALDDVTAH